MTTREIVLDGGSPWGFRMHGGADVGQPLRISRVNPGSKAAQKGIREGDVISSINGLPTRGISNSDAHALLRNAGQTLHLGLNEECGGSPKRRAHRSSQQQEVTKHSSQQSTSRFSGSVNGVTDQNYNTVTSRGKEDASTEGVSSSETKGKRRQKQSAPTQHSLAPPLQEESPGSSAVSSDVKEEPAASPSKSKKRKRNRKKNRAQQKNAAATANDGKASQTSATSTDVLDLVQQISSKDVEEVDKSKSLKPSIDDNISHSSTVIETHLIQQNSSRSVEEVDTSQLVETSKEVMLGNISQSSAVLETNTVQQKVSHIKNINNSRIMKHSKDVTEKSPTSLETELVQQKSSKDIQELNGSKSSSSIDIREDTTFSTLSEIDVVQQTGTLIVTVNAEDSTESELNSANRAETNMTSQEVNDMVNPIEHSGTEKDQSCDERIDTNEQKAKKSNGGNQDNYVIGEDSLPRKVQDNSSVSVDKVGAGNTELGAKITTNIAAVVVNTHNTVSSEEKTNVQEAEENSGESQKRHPEVTMLSNLRNQDQTTAEISRGSQRVLETSVQVKSCQSSVECRAVVVETVDEDVWEEAVEFSVEGIHDPGAESCPLTSNTVSLQQYDLTPEDEELLDPRPLIAADEEETLRNFLYSLNLADYGRDSPRRGKRRSSHEVACNPVHHQRGLEVIMEENSSEISDSGDSKRGKGWKDAIYIPGTNEIVYLNEDSADEGEYTTEEASSKTENAMRSLYYAETTTTLTTDGTSSAEMREFIYRTVGETAKDDEDVFSAHMEKMLEADAENGPQIIELASEEEEDKEDVVTTQKTEEQQSGVEVVFVEDDTTSTSSGAPANWEDVEDAPYEDVMFPIQGQPKYTHRREDSIYENMDVDYGRDPEPEDDTVYENVDFTKRDAQVHVSFSTSSSEPRVSSRHLTSLVPPEQDNSVAESSKRVQLENDNGLTTCNSETTVSSRHLTSLFPPEQGASVGESPKQVQQESSKEQPTCNSEPTVSSRHLNGKTTESVGELLEQVQLFDDAHSPRPAKRNSEPEVSGQNMNCLVIETSESVGESLEERQHAGDVQYASSLDHKVSNLSENCLVPPTVSEQETEQITARSQEEVEASSCRTHHVISGRDISNNMGEEINKEPEGQDAVDDGRDSITPTNNLSRRGSSSSDDTASQGTAFYCPVDAHSPALSSDADISSLTEEVPEARRKKVHPIPRNVTNPLSLKELCIATVVCMPYGTYILNILGVRPHPTPVRESPQHIPVPCDEQWLATPTLDDPNLLVYLSPSQRKVYNEEVPSPDEMQSLLDLHCKFLQRRGYHEKPPPLPPSRKYRPLTSPRGDTKISPASRSSSSRLLAILREASEQEKVKAPPLPPPPDMSSCCKSTPPAERLKVRSLSDWLQLVRCTGGEANENTNGGRNKDSTPPILSTQSSPGVVRRSAQLTGNHLVRCAGGEKTNGARSKDSTPPILSTQSSPGTVRRSVSGQSENQLGWFVGCSANEYANGPTSPILSTQSSPGAPRRSQRSLPGPEEEPVPVRGQDNHLRRSLQEPEEEQAVRDQENRRFDADNYHISKRGDIAIINSSRPQQEDRSLRPRSLPPPSEALVTGGEIFRQQMYLEYMHKVAERTERRRQRVIRLSSVPREDDMTTTESAGGPLENEFMDKVRERMDKLGIRYDDEDGDDGRPNGVGQLPKHLQEFLTLTSDSAEDVTGVWSPSTQKSSSEQDQAVQQKEKVGGEGADDAPPVVWTPKSAGASPTTERKEFRPIKFESPTLSRKNRSGTSTPAPKTSDGSCSEVETVSTATTTAGTTTTTFSSTFQPWQTRDDSTLISSEQRVISSSSSSSTTTDRRLVQSQSAPASGLSSLAAGTASTKLPRAQNPTITLLQKAREGQLPKGALYLDHRMNSKEGENAYISPNEIMYSVKKEYDSEGQNTQRKKIVELTPRKFEGIGPTTDEGVPIVLRSEIKDANQAKWYKRMYDSLHRAGKDDDYITIRYKTRKGQYPYTSPGGYLSEPEPACYDSDIGFSAKYATLDRRRIKNKENDFTTSTLPRSRYVPHPSSIKYATQVYKNQPGRIEDYEPGRSSISEKETKQWWDEVLDIFDGWLESYSPHHPTYRSSSQLTTKADATTTTMYQQRASAEQQTNQSTPANKTFMAHALKDGYESDSTLVFKRRDENLQSQISPAEQKQAYKTIQKGGEVPLHGLRKPAPERPKESPHRYVESEVTIHYRSPVRSEAKEALSEEELARRQAEAMRRIYQEERRRKYLQELQDMHSRRHTDNFTPSQKSPIPLNRYDDFFDDVGNKSKSRDRTPEPKLVARALYNFVGQTSRELSFRRGDIIFVRRQIDKNWYEGEHNAMVGLFPFNYVEIIPYDGIRTMPKRPTEGQARAKFNFIAQTHLELSLVKGELVVLTRRVDDNWFEGRIGNRKGIFPVSYVEVLQEPGEKPVTSSAPPSKPASHTTLVNGTGIKQSMGSHSYQPSFYYSHNKTSSPYTSTNPYATLPRQSHLSKQSLAPVNQTLHIDTHSEPVPYRALYNYRPQNEDELELCEGDTVYVMEKCDDGWYVGSSQRTGYFGTFPGNYVERI